MTKKIFPWILILMTFFSINGLAQKNKKQTKVLISTSYGDIKLLLYNETPKHRDNFIKLVEDEFYNGTLFHRVMDGFMIQGGDPDSRNAQPGQMLGNGGPGYTIPAEFNARLIHKKGALAAARQPDNVNPNKESSGSQFYIVHGKSFEKEELDSYLKKKNKRRETPLSYTEEQEIIYKEIGGYAPLDMEYTVFGEVIEGLEVIDAIAKVEKDRSNRPNADVKMTVKIVKK